MWNYVEEECKGRKERDKINHLLRVWNTECEKCGNNSLNNKTLSD